MLKTIFEVCPKQVAVSANPEGQEPCPPAPVMTVSHALLHPSVPGSGELSVSIWSTVRPLPMSPRVHASSRLKAQPSGNR